MTTNNQTELLSSVNAEECFCISTIFSAANTAIAYGTTQSTKSLSSVVLQLAAETSKTGCGACANYSTNSCVTAISACVNTANQTATGLSACMASTAVTSACKGYSNSGNGCATFSKACYENLWMAAQECYDPTQNVTDYTQFNNYTLSGTCPLNTDVKVCGNYAMASKACLGSTDGTSSKSPTKFYNSCAQAMYNCTQGSEDYGQCIGKADSYCAPFHPSI